MSPASLRAAAAAQRNKAPVDAAAKEGVRVGGGAERLIHPGGHRQPAPAAAVSVFQFEHAGRRVEAGAAEQGGVDVVSLHVIWRVHHHGLPRSPSDTSPAHCPPPGPWPAPRDVRYDLEHYCELIAALKLRTTNKAGRHLSTERAIQLLEEFGVETTQVLVRAPAGLLSVPTVNRWLSLYRLDQPRLLREPPAAHETLYHFHKPETELQANEWLWNYLLRYIRLVHGRGQHAFFASPLSRAGGPLSVNH